MHKKQENERLYYRLELNKITEVIIGCAYTVGKNLGCGFLEKVYENALAHEIRKAGLEVRRIVHDF